MHVGGTGVQGDQSGGVKGVAEQLTSWWTRSRVEQQQEGARGQQSLKGHTPSNPLSLVTSTILRATTSHQ